MRLLYLFLIILIPNLFIAQSFTRITTGPVSTETADSRACSFVDVNNDGWLDLFISNGPSGGQNNSLYLNDGTGNFSTLENNAIVHDGGSSDGAAFADIDNDGNLDAFVVTWYGQVNYFYQNNGDGIFEHLPDAITGNTGTHSEATSWGDYDADGYIDLMITNSGGNKRNLLYRNINGQSFEKINEAPFSNDNNTSRAISWVDYDLDNDLDLYICNESNEKNLLYENNGNSTFIKILNSAITADFNSSMSSSWGDVDNDGDLDLFLANARYLQEADNQLFFNNGDGTFTESTATIFEADGGCSYSSSFADIDNDADLDLIVTNGYCNANLKEFLYLNDGTGNFSRAQNILPNLPTLCSYGCAWGDYNNDGFLDLVIAHCKNNSNQNEPANSLYQNNGNDNHWIKIGLEGTISNRTAIGAKVKLKAEIDGQSIWQMREITSQSGHCSQNSMKAHFGLKDAITVDSLIIEWPSGFINKYAALPADSCHSFIEEFVDNTLETDNLNQTLNCFPNPSNAFIHIVAHFLKPQKEIQLRLIDMSGKIAFNKKYSPGLATSFSEKLALPQIKITPGIYICQLEGKELRLEQKIIVK